MPTPLCTYGSVPKPTAPTWDYIDQAYMVGQIGVIAGWLTNWALGITTAPFEVSSFCATEPVDDLPTAADYVKLAFPPLAWASGTYTRFGNQIRRYKFDQLCQCNPNPSSSCVQRWADSHSWPGYNGAAGSSFELGNKFTVSQSGLSFYGFRVWHSQAINTNVGYTLWDNTTGLSVASLTVGGNTVGYHQFLLSTPFALVNGRQYTVSYGLPASYTYYSTTLTTPPTNASVTYDGSVYGVVSLRPILATGGDTAIDPVVCTTSGGSGVPTAPGPPPTLTPPTGFPDPPTLVCTTSQHVCDAIQTLLNKLEILEAKIETVKQFKVPFAYIAGTAATGLTGDGTISVVGILGVIVSLTTIPSTWGRTSDVPPRMIPKAGALQWVIAGNVTEEFQLHYADEIFFQSLPLESAISYSLRPGFVASITAIYPAT